MDDEDDEIGCDVMRFQQSSWFQTTLLSFMVMQSSERDQRTGDLFPMAICGIRCLLHSIRIIWMGNARKELNWAGDDQRVWHLHSLEIGVI